MPDTGLYTITRADAPQGRELFAGLPEVLDVRAVAGALGVSEKTVRREIKRGELRSFRVGTCVRVRRCDLVDYVGGALRPS